jgi:hypothetical protein
MQLGFIGTGEITSSIVTGLSSSGVAAHAIWLSPRNSAIANALADRFRGISVASGNQEVLDHSYTIVIAVRPSAARGVLSELRFRPDHQVIRKIFLNGRCRSFGRGSSREVAQRNRFYRAILVIPTINTTNVSNPAPILCAHNAAPTAPAKPKTIVYVSQSNEGRFCGSSVTLVTHLSFVEMLDTIEHHPS